MNTFKRGVIKVCAALLATINRNGRERIAEAISLAGGDRLKAAPTCGKE